MRRSVTSRTTRLFLGLRTQCVQCHDHPFSGDWKQEHFWGINAFFRQVDPSGRPTMMAKKKKDKNTIIQNFTLKDNPSLNPKGMVPYERRNAVVYLTKPVFLDGQKMPPLSGDGTRRKELARFVVKSDWFAIRKQP